MLAKKIGLIVAGGALGGLTGYLVALLIVAKAAKKEEEEYKWLPEQDSIEEQTGDAKDTEKHNARLRLDYTQFSKEKGKLEELAEPYKTQVKPVRIVPAKDVEESKLPFEQVKYYEGDQVFMDSKEQLIDDPNTMFVANVWLHFGEQSEDADIVYIRNDNLGIDFEITRIHGKYSVLILGEPETPPKQPRRRKGKTTPVVEEEDGPEPDED